MMSKERKHWLLAIGTPITWDSGYSIIQRGSNVVLFKDGMNIGRIDSWHQPMQQVSLQLVGSSWCGTLGC